jgi:hypothetical protein
MKNFRILRQAPSGMVQQLDLSASELATRLLPDPLINMLTTTIILEASTASGGTVRISLPTLEEFDADVQVSDGPLAPLKELFDSFTIALDGRSAVDDEGTIYAAGQYKFGKTDRIELIAAYLDRWAEADYKRQWLDGLRRVLDGTNSRSCLVLSVHPMKYGGGVEHLEMHLVGAVVAFRYCILSNAFVGLDREIDPHGLYDLIEPLEGRPKASEWCVTVEALKDCLRRLEAD